MRKGQQQGTAAGLVATIAGLIILYILFLPPAERAELLGDAPPHSTVQREGYNGPDVSNQVIFVTSPGRIRYQSLDEYEYDLPSFTLIKNTDAQVIETINNFRVRNGVFDKVSRNVTFVIDDVRNTDNLLLSFNSKRHKGTLTIRLNGNDIYNYDVDTTSPAPVSLSTRLLSNGANTLEFSVSGVGMKFWTTNEYSFSNMQITGDITDNSRQASRNSFYISPEEGANIEKAVLKFNPDCTPRDVGVLDVSINARNIFSGVPDCGTLNTFSVPPNYLNDANNKVTFKTSKGTYLIDQIQIKTFLTEPIQPTYYFEMDDKYFSTVSEGNEDCGVIDGVCPGGCSEDADYDCCFEENPKGYWCDIPTKQTGDRCVEYVEETEYSRCQSGYEDRSGDLPEACKDELYCGDDEDGECPEGCSQKYDKDCCFDLPGDQYWCDDMPVTGETAICVSKLTRSTCQYCLTGYKAESSHFSCDFGGSTEAELRKGLDVVMTFRFTESRDVKEAEVWVNGKKTGFDTRESSYRKNINSLVEPGTNSIRIKPRTDLDIREIEVKFD